MATPIRRIVTGHDAAGKAVVIMDSDCPNTRFFPAGGRTTTKVWQTDECPAPYNAADDRGALQSGTAPGPGGSIFRIVEFPPLTEEQLAALSHEEVFEGQGAVSPGAAAQANPFMHRTETVDYAIIMKGEIDMLMDDSSVHMKEGDVMVQQGTNHAWVNTGTEPCMIAFVLIDGKPG